MQDKIPSPNDINLPKMNNTWQGMGPWISERGFGSLLVQCVERQGQFSLKCWAYSYRPVRHRLITHTPQKTKNISTPKGLGLKEVIMAYTN